MNTFNFKYKNDRLYNIVSFIFLLIFGLISYLILKNIDFTINKILFILLTFIIVYLLSAFVNKLVCVTNGRFTFDKHSFIYETLSNEYTINYQEIEYINKSIYIDTDNLIRKENYIYNIKIKNAGYFSFKYCNDSLDEAIEELALRSNKEIDE